MIAANIMTTDVYTLTCRNTMKDAIKLVLEKKIRQVPVVDDEKRVIGVITPQTLIKAILPKYITEGYLEDVKFAPELPEFVENIDALADKSVCDYMDKKYVKVKPETSTMEVATLYVTSREPIESIVVVDDQERILGVISRWDIFKRLCEYSERKKNR